MKKNYFVLIILFVIIASLKANAFNITVNVDDASRVSLYLGSSKVTMCWMLRLATVSISRQTQAMC